MRLPTVSAGALLPLCLSSVVGQAWADEPASPVKLTEPFKPPAPRPAPVVTLTRIDLPPAPGRPDPARVPPAADPSRDPMLVADFQSPRADEEPRCRDAEAPRARMTRTERLRDQNVQAALVVLRWSLPPGDLTRATLLSEQRSVSVELPSCTEPPPPRREEPTPVVDKK